MFPRVRKHLGLMAIGDDELEQRMETALQVGKRQAPSTRMAPIRTWCNAALTLDSV